MVIVRHLAFNLMLHTCNLICNFEVKSFSLMFILFAILIQISALHVWLDFHLYMKSGQVSDRSSVQILPQLPPGKQEHSFSEMGVLSAFPASSCHLIPYKMPLSGSILFYH